MTVSSVSATDSNSASSIYAEFKKRIQDFQSLASSIQSGDLSSAQKAMAAFQQDLQNAPANSTASSIWGTNTQLGQDLQAVQTALQSGDAAGAQQAMATLQQDLQSAFQSQGTPRAHHHHHPHADGDDSSAALGSSSSTTSGATAQTADLPPGSLLNIQA